MWNTIWDDVREMLWLASIIGGLSIAGWGLRWYWSPPRRTGVRGATLAEIGWVLYCGLRRMQGRR